MVAAHHMYLRTPTLTHVCSRVQPCCSFEAASGSRILRVSSLNGGGAMRGTLISVAVGSGGWLPGGRGGYGMVMVPEESWWQQWW